MEEYKIEFSRPSLFEQVKDTISNFFTGSNEITLANNNSTTTNRQS